MKDFNFKIEKKQKGCRARAGIFHTPHGDIETPVFVPVATQASIKAVPPRDIKEMNVRVILSNTYHLYLRPGDKIVKKLGGLHKFMSWDRPIMTDSGGFQVFSLGFGLEHGVGKIANIFPDEERKNKGRYNGKQERKNFVKIDEDGVTFTSHIDGSLHRFTPEKSIEIQQNLGADIILAFDECTSPLAGKKYTKEAMERTHRWAKRCLTQFKNSKSNPSTGSGLAWNKGGGAKAQNKQALFGIVQGGEYEDLRRISATFISSLDFGGIAVGGSLGKSKIDMHKILGWTIPLLPYEKPRHLLGIGGVEDFFECIERGVDSFDCVAPTREARNGALMTKNGRLNILKAIYKIDKNPIEKDCGCYTCRNFSRAYLRHLFVARELLAYHLATIHNIYFTYNLVKKIRQSILDGNFLKFKKKFLKVGNFKNKNYEKIF